MSDRVDRLVQRLGGAEVDALLITDLINLRYLAGFVGSNGLALIGPQTRMFATDFRYAVQMTQQVDESFDRRQLPRNLLSAVGDVLPEGRLRLGFETSMPVRIHTRLRQVLPDRVELVGVDGLVEGLRAVKDASELERIRASSALADQALEQSLSQGMAGRTERALALALEMNMRQLGADRAGFEPIVAAGSQAALPHATPRDHEIQPDQLVLIDWGAQLDGYCSDCTRTLAVGEPGPEAREVYAMVLEAQLAGLAAVRAGAECRHVDAAARDLIDRAGHGEEFGHALGHGVGLDVHEDPRLAASSEQRLACGNVVTVEPGIYLTDRFGVRIEDLVVVGEDGCEILTRVSKELLVVD